VNPSLPGCASPIALSQTFGIVLKPGVVVAIDDADDILPEHVPGVIGTLASPLCDIHHCGQEAEYLPIQEAVSLWANLERALDYVKAKQMSAQWIRLTGLFRQ
jgi:hypothetical protein